MWDQMRFFFTLGRLIDPVRESDDDFVEPSCAKKQNRTMCLTGIQEVFDQRLEEMGVTEEMLQNDM